LAIHPICAGNNDSPELSAAEITRLRKEAEELWKGDPKQVIPKHQNLLAQIKRAIPSLEERLKLISPLPDNPEYLASKAELYWTLGIFYGCLLKIEEAIQAFNESLKLKEKLWGPDDPRLLDLVTTIADLRSVQRRPSDAIPLYERALTLSEKKFGAESVEAATVLASLGNTTAQAGQFEPALACLKRSLQIREKMLSPTDPDVATATFNLGSIYLRRGDYAQAMPLLERSVASLEKTDVQGDSTSAFLFARVLTNLGSAQVDIGEYDKAIATLQRAVAVAELTFGSASINLVGPLDSIGGAYRRRGDFDRAQQFFERALRILEEFPTYQNTEHVDVLNNLALTLLHLGDEDGALKLFSQARDMGESQLGPTELPVACSLNGLALINQQRGKVADALALFERSRAIFESRLGPSHPDVAVALNYIAELLASTGDTDRALSTLQKALAIQEKALPPNHPDIAATLHRLARLSIKHGKLIEAQNLLRKSIAITDAAVGQDNPDSCAGLIALGTAEVFKGDVSKGLGEFVESTKRWRRYVARQTLFQQGSEAVLIQQEAQLSRDWFNSLCGVAPLNTSESAFLAGAEQLAFGKALLEEVETIRAQLTADDRTLVHTLREQARSARMRLDAIPKQEAVAWLRHRADWQNSERDKLERELKATEDKLASVSELVSQTVTESKLSLIEIARCLPSDAALVDFIQYRRMSAGTHWREQRYAAYLTFPLLGDSSNVVVERVDLGEAAPIDEAVGVIAKRFAAGQYRAKDLQPAFQRLSDLVYVPLAKHLTNVSHLIICPDGQLNRISFEILPVGNKFLLEEKTISYVTSAREIIRLDAARSKPKSRSQKSLVMGNPDFDLDLAKNGTPKSVVQLAGATASFRSLSRDCHGLKFKPLPNAEAEARSVAKLVGSDTELRLGADARESELKTVQSPRVLDLATHAFFLSDQELKQINSVDFNSALSEFGPVRSTSSDNWENPLVRCGMALSGANHAQQTTNGIAEDGLLTGLEASLLNLRGTELVILSACDSGSGEVKIGEGVMSLRRAFRIAGAETVLASQWKVNDKATSQLMIEFVRRWRAGEQRAHAWREAQLTLLRSKDFSNPFFWAAFTLTGEWR
jgi:CHAT domain-containing protein/tetratricopeptide (TPR) repeat protein